MSIAELGFGNLSEVFFKIEQLLERIEHSTTHYQALDLDRAASREDVVSAYRQTVMVLNPIFNELKAVVPEDRSCRAKIALARVGEAYSTLFNQTRRSDYDNWLRRRTNDTGLPDTMGTEAQSKPADSTHGRSNASEIGLTETIEVEHFARPVAVGSSAASTDRRRMSRFKMRLPGRIVAYKPSGEKFYMPLETLDVSRYGAAVRTPGHPKIGNIMRVALPMPTKLRTHNYADQAYNTFAIVRRVEQAQAEGRIVGMEFLGERPPTGYLDKPWAVFRLGRWAGADRRREPRIKIAEPVGLDFLDESLKSLGNDVGVTENISPSGARLFVRSAPPSFECVRVTCYKLNFESIGFVSDRFSGPDGLERICLRFADMKWPIDLTSR
jgi:curved DNA-binding protein CbpA